MEENACLTTHACLTLLVRGSVYWVQDMGIDARLHLDKGGKVTEFFLEYLDMSGMKGGISVAKFEGAKPQREAPKLYSRSRPTSK